MGIGRDGHWAFNEPGSSLASRTRVQALAKETLDDNYESFYRQAGIAREEMPHFAITMGIGTILEARNILMLANGKKKAQVVAKALEGPVTSQVTASAIQLYSGKATVVLDREAASELKHRILLSCRKIKGGNGRELSIKAGAPAGVTVEAVNRDLRHWPTQPPAGSTATSGRETGGEVESGLRQQVVFSVP